MDRNPDAAFGLLNHTMISKINRLLKPFRLRLKVRCNCRQWGDQVEVTVEKFVPAWDGKIHTGSCGSPYGSNCPCGN